MELIDDEGNLLGLVNVIDALAVLLVLAVVVAGLALVLPGDGGEPATRYATVDLGEQPGHVANQIAAGDRSRPDAQGNLTVTDVFVTPGETNTVRVIARVELRGTTTGEPPNDQFTFAGERLHAGHALSIHTAGYDAEGRITRLADEGEDLRTDPTPVRLEAAVPADVARGVAAGDEFVLADRTVATVDEVEIGPTHVLGERHVSLGATLETYRGGDRPLFANGSVRIGSVVPFETDAYALRPQIVQVGTLDSPGEVTETDVTIAIDGVSPEIADGIRSGMTETLDGTTYAEITNKRTENATVILESEDGDIHRREHPVNQDVTLDATLRTRQTDAGLTFHARSLREGEQITLDLGSITVRGTVVDIDV